MLAKVNGEPRDLRLPLADGDRIAAPDHARRERPGRAVRAPPLVRAPARRGGAAALPGREGRDRPADRERLLLRLRLPGADRRGRPRAHRGRKCARRSRRAASGRARRSRATTRSKRFEAEGEPYKVELVGTAEGDISLYTQGDFTDLCRGPHLQNAKPIKAFKLTGLAGAYWRGDEKNKQLTRIYGTAFYSQADLDAYLELLEEARKRDHRRLGTQLDLFHLEEVSPGSPFWHPKGMVIWNVLEDLRRRENEKRGYVEVKTPVIFEKTLWETSGHWEKFRENMFLIPDGERTYGLKPMNCPGHMRIFGNRLRSYRELPLRLAEAGTLHRNELAGTLHGLTRVRHVTQDDSHLFCTRDQIEDEIFGCLDFTAYLYELFGLDYEFELSTRPDNKLGTDEEWDFTEGALRAALERRGLEYELNEGDGAFYGPKIDLHMTDSLGRSWQMGTVQLDSQMPQRFGLTYVGPDNREHTPYVIHRASFGSLERFIGILIEHYARRVPVLARAGPDPGRSRSARATGWRPPSSPAGSSRTGWRSTSPTTPSASGSGTPRSRRSRTWSSTATRSRTRRSRSGSTAGRQETLSLQEFPGETCYPESLASRGVTVSHLPAAALRRFNRCRLTRLRAAACQRFFRIYEEVNTSLVKDI